MRISDAFEQTTRVEMVLLSAMLLVDLGLSYPNPRRFVDYLFIQGMIAIVVGSFLAARLPQKFAQSSAMRAAVLESENTSVSTSSRNFPRLGMRMLVVGMLLVTCAIIIGEIWIRRTLPP